MGNNQANSSLKTFSKTSQHNTFLDKIFLAVQEIYNTAQLLRERKRGLISNKEKDLLLLIKQKTSIRNKNIEIQKAFSIIGDLKLSQAFEVIMKYCDALKANVFVIMNSNGELERIKDLIPIIESLIWGCEKCGIQAGATFSQVYCHNFLFCEPQSVTSFKSLTAEIQDIFALLSSTEDLSSYLSDFCKKHEVSLDKLNEAGHGIGVAKRQKMILLMPKNNKDDSTNKMHLAVPAPFEQDSDEKPSISPCFPHLSHLSPITQISPFTKDDLKAMAETPIIIQHFFPVEMIAKSTDDLNDLNEAKNNISDLRERSTNEPRDESSTDYDSNHAEKKSNLILEFDSESNKENETQPESPQKLLKVI